MIFILRQVIVLTLILNAASFGVDPMAKVPTQAFVANESSRRDWIQRSAMALVAATTLSQGANAATAAAAAATAASSLSTFTDELHGFSLGIPTSWTMRREELFDRRALLVWSDPTDAATSLFIAYTPVRDDYTSLGSFGSVDQVAAQTILPKTSLMNEKDTSSQATLLSAVSAKQAYLFDYTQATAQQPLTHYRSIFTLSQGATGGAGAVLVTITAQTPEPRYATVQSTLDAMIQSYTALKK